MTDYLFVANNVALDFVNTEVMLAGARTDLLKSFADFAEWCAKAGLAPEGDVRRLAEEWPGSREARKALLLARVLREVLRKAAEKAARTGRVPDGLADYLSKVLENPRLASEVEFSEGRLKTHSRWVLEKPQDLLVPVAHHAADFFSTADYSAIRKCESPECILFFHDTSKNQSRRWCSMELCGNRAKVAAFRRRG